MQYKATWLAALALSIAGTASAGDWAPNKPIRLIVPYATGGTTDLVGRVLSIPLGQELGQQVVVENRGGAGGSLGMGAVAKAAPDGYTLGMPAIGAHASNETLIRDLPYNSEKDFQSLSFVGYSPLVLVVHPSNPADSVQKLLARRKELGRPLTFASGGLGLTAHIAGELLKLRSGQTDMTHIGYKGGGPAMVDMMGNQVDMLFVPIGSALPHLRSGKLKAIAVASKERTPKLPGVPTMLESGFPDFVMAESFGVVGPAGLPADVAKRLVDAIALVLRNPDLIKRFDEQGVIASSSTPQELSDYIQGEVRRYRDVITRAGIKAN